MMQCRTDACTSQACGPAVPTCPTTPTAAVPRPLHLYRVLRGEQHAAAVSGRLEGHPLFGDVSQVQQRHHLHQQGRGGGAASECELASLQSPN